jgi:stearoyl-CoA desaturase (delta-9 desaturase)
MMTDEPSFTPLIRNAPQSIPARLSQQRYIPYIRTLNLLAVTLPFVGLVLAIALTWGRGGMHWEQLGLFVGMYLLTGLGVTVGYHRLFTHRSFEAPRLVKATLAILGGMAVEGPLLRWVAQHRCHHHHSDDEGDPHSPHAIEHGAGGTAQMVRGLWHAHVGWLFLPDSPKLGRYVKDLRSDRMLRTISQMFPIWAILGLMIPAMLGGLLTLSWMGILYGFLWGGLARIFFVHHVTWSINSVCHFWGTRPFETGDMSRNNALFGVLGFGEGWHNNHHAFPTSARHGLRWWQLDLSYYIIQSMRAIGLASNVRLPAVQAMAWKRRTPEC